jgi:hypothetical protein
MQEPQGNLVAIHGVGDTFDIHCAAINASSAGDNTIIPAQTGKKIRVLGIKLSCGGNVTVTWKQGLGGSAASITDEFGTALAAESFADKGGMADFWGPWGWMFESGEGLALNMYLSASVQVSGFINFILV